MSNWLDGIRAAVETERAIDAAQLRAMGYLNVRLLPNEKWAALQNMVYTTGLIVGLTKFVYERRYCYERYEDALDALDAWDGSGDPSGPWIKEKPSDRLGPGVTTGKGS